MTNDEKQQIINSTMSAAEQHTAAIAKLYMSKPRSTEEQIDVTIRIADHGVQLAKCFSALILVGAMDSGLFDDYMQSRGMTHESVAEAIAKAGLGAPKVDTGVN